MHWVARFLIIPSLCKYTFCAVKQDNNTCLDCQTALYHKKSRSVIQIPSFLLPNPNITLVLTPHKLSDFLINEGNIFFASSPSSSYMSVNTFNNS